MANAAEARGFDTVLWPTVLSHNGLLANQPKKGEQAESAEEQQRNIKTAADAAANALRPPVEGEGSSWPEGAGPLHSLRVSGGQ